MLDSAGAPVPDGLVEIWQADAEGRYDGGWGWGRCATDADGHFAFTTVKPGAVREPDGSIQAPHVTMLCFARGLLKPVLTRIYFADEAEANAARSRPAGDCRRRRAGDADRRTERPRRAIAST